jgi:hypothetical protein
MAAIPVNHPLYPADLRVKRARRNIGTLKRHLSRWANAHQDAFRVKNMGGGRYKIEPAGQWAAYHLLPLASLTIGETVYNLRTAEIGCH